MRNRFSSYFYFKARSKAKRKTKKKFDWLAAGLIFASAFSFYCVLFPESSGLWGQKLARFLGWLSGVGQYALPILVGFAGFLSLLRQGKPTSLLKIVLSSALFWAGLILMTLLGEAVWATNYGGILGLVGTAFFVRLFGDVGAWIVDFGIIATLSILLAGFSPGDIFHKMWDVLATDWAAWQKARKEKEPVKTKKPPVVKPAAQLGADVPKKTIVPKIISSKPEPAPKPIQEKKPEPKKTPQKVEPKAEVEKKAEKKQENLVPYQSPSLEIFEAAGGGNPVPKEELTQRARHLEQTLANFKIAASVVEIHPGPVITRYDLEPAAGVKVSSISSRADDLALAMKSIGIRVLAPIPGKGAVGIEIPNSKPEQVGLQELMSKPEFANHKSPLAFVLGKTVSGEPYYVDLAAMPHMLVAGATGAGKSVAIHAMISSILYRMPPERVKFVLIDPKRLELPSYSLIPHLYDPLHDPINARVITNSKEASKALSRLVKVMEYRYELFSKANVRNIDSYNNKMKREGKKEECYLVVVIDELADLMLTSPKEVEDSIQRLAQMARAVGIHLVLATQRPSVDVITGVIKANLPSRIALRVATAIDSRVIVDTVGAESLLGKGDMLFLPPASPEPIRVQGAFVSEGEVENLVNHLKQFGPPNYDDLFSSGSALEFAVEDKKEMKDLIEALKLVLERKRVSQDLLKAHFGSSARATNILSLLEVKEFIRKPEGSNRWEINFDMIEEFLTKGWKHAPRRVNELRAGALFLILFFGGVLTGWSYTLKQVLNEIQTKEDRLKTLRFDFSQQVKFQLNDLASETKGKASLGKKGRMRIKKTHPDQQVTISNGRQVWVYKPAYKQVWQGSRKEMGERKLFPKSLLPLNQAVKSLKEGYDLRLDETNKENVRILAVPKDVSLGYSLDLVFSTVSWLPLETIYRSESAVVTTEFSNIEENPKLKESVFSFSPPEGTDIIQF